MPDVTGEAFAAAMAALPGGAALPGQRLGIAVSGGPDSIALLDLAAAYAPGRTEAATVDHGLRAEAAAEAVMVARWCDGQGIPHAILRPSVPITGSVQARARAVRYALLDAWMDERGLDWLLTAHHADDQIETMLMRLNRSSGVAGLAGIRARRGRVVRPLLGFRKAALEEYVRARGIPHVADPSNNDERYDRARLRAALAGADWLDPSSAARSAAALADADSALTWSAQRLYADLVVPHGDGLRLASTDLPHEYLRRLLALMLAALTPDSPEPRGERIDDAVFRLRAGDKISIGACIATGGTVWTLRQAPPRRTG